MNQQNSHSSEWKKTQCRNTTNLAYWTLGWLVTMAIATFGPLLVWPGNNVLTVLMVGVNLIVGAGMIISNKRHLEGLDELMRKIHLEAMALSLGVALVVGLGYSTLDIANVISFDAEISHLVMLIGVTYGVAVFVGTRRYS